MELYIEKNQKKLRLGFTTGSCAAAASKAAALMLVGKEPVDCVKIKTPFGAELLIDIIDTEIKNNYVVCSVIKDSGDDPDITDGIKISAKVSKIQRGILIDGGKGIGRVTRKGLPVEIGKAAINPAPMAQIKAAVEEVCLKCGYNGGFKIIISAENGEQISLKTFNPNLGIVGGISILGTSGIVEPMSERALIETIKAEINLKYSENKEAVFLCLGNYGRDFALSNYSLDFDKAVKCSNFIGEALDYCVYKGFKKILLIGHAGKLIKLAGGIMNTHSKTADCRAEIFAAHSAMYGIEPNDIKKIMECATTEECIDILYEHKDKKDIILKSIEESIKRHLISRIGSDINVEFIIFTLKRGEIIKTENAFDLIDEINKIGGQ